MIVYIGADHRGYAYKEEVAKVLEKLSVDVIDVGTHDKKNSSDYPQYAKKVATGVVKSKDNRGILICMSGVGQSIAANKIKGAYAAFCYDARSAKYSRLHNNANILVVGVRAVKKKDLEKIIKIWLKTDFEGGRHQRRLNQIKKIESGLGKK